MLKRFLPDVFALEKYLITNWFAEENIFYFFIAHALNN